MLRKSPAVFAWFCFSSSLRASASKYGICHSFSSTSDRFSNATGVPAGYFFSSSSHELTSFVASLRTSSGLRLSRLLVLAGNLAPEEAIRFCIRLIESSNGDAYRVTLWYSLDIRSSSRLSTLSILCISPAWSKLCWSAMLSRCNHSFCCVRVSEDEGAACALRVMIS